MKVVIGNCELYLGRCEDILPDIGWVDCLVTDPPYEFSASGGGKMRKARKCLDDIEKHQLDQGFDFKIINPLLYQSAVVFCHNAQLHKLLPYMAGNYHRHVLCTWEKSNPIPVANKNYLPDLEPYIHAWQYGYHPLGELADKKRTIRTTNGKSEYDHPTVKPDAVMDKIMRNINGKKVIDPFMGSGSTGCAALRHGKHFIGIEKEEKFFEIACKRLAAMVD